MGSGSKRVEGGKDDSWVWIWLKDHHQQTYRPVFDTQAFTVRLKSYSDRHLGELPLTVTWRRPELSLQCKAIAHIGLPFKAKELKKKKIAT